MVTLARERLRSIRQYLDVRQERSGRSGGRIVEADDFGAAFRQNFPPVYRLIARRAGAAPAEDLAAKTLATPYRHVWSFDLRSMP